MLQSGSVVWVYDVGVHDIPMTPVELIRGKGERAKTEPERPQSATKPSNTDFPNDTDFPTIE